MFKECPEVVELNGISQSSHMDQYVPGCSWYINATCQPVKVPGNIIQMQGIFLEQNALQSNNWHT
jgi:hypothetical protein